MVTKNYKQTKLKIHKQRSNCAYFLCLLALKQAQWHEHIESDVLSPVDTVS